MKTVQAMSFILMAAAQLAVPCYMIATREETLQSGVAYKFRCGPVDPYDYFRGRYVALSFRDNTIEQWKGERFEWGSPAFALLGRDGDGFATILNVTSSPPDSGDYLQVRVSSAGYQNAPLSVTFPFDRYFMNEIDAPAAEEAYRARMDTQEGAYAVVRVRDGQGVIEGLFIGGVPAEMYLQRSLETQAGDKSP